MKKKLSFRFPLLVACMAPSLVLAVTDKNVIWEIGKPDNSHSEFALSGKYRDYRVKFPRDPIFNIGFDSPAYSWPYIHPGPKDGWAGQAKRSFTVFFDQGDKRFPFYALRIRLIATHETMPPMVNVSVNRTPWQFSTDKGPLASPDSPVVVDNVKNYTVTFKAEHLKDKDNRIIITSTEGSWMVYDSVQLLGLNELGAATDLEAILKPRWHHGPDGPSRLVILTFKNGSLEGPASVETQYQGKKYRQNVPGEGRPIDRINLYLPIDNASKIETAHITVNIGERRLSKDVEIVPERQWKVHLVHQTHVDIGYTDVQEAALRKQVNNLTVAMKYVSQKRSYSPAAQFRWHPEVMWPVHEFMRKASPYQKDEFIHMVRSGHINLGGFYGHVLTGICSEEELFETFSYARDMAREFGLVIDTALQTDVPGCTWGIVPALAHNGIKYLSTGPNAKHRVGRSRAWNDRPFYWVSPSGKEKVLVWMAGTGYSWFHGQPVGHKINHERLLGYLGNLVKNGYPYDLVQIRYAIGRDNGPPNPAVSDFVSEWNKKYAYPKMIVSTASQMFRDLESRYSETIPVVSGDFTPYWEDGAASTAADTGLNRVTCERIVQAQALWSVLDPAGFPADDFREAWTQAMLYDEHTWGGFSSISKPDSDFVIQQAARKQQFALDASKLAENLIEGAMQARRKEGSNVIDVYNTSGFIRKRELVVISAAQSTGGDRVAGEGGQAVPSQRLASGELAFIAENIPGLGTGRFRIGPGKHVPAGSVRVDGLRMMNSLISLSIDPSTGGISSLRHEDVDADLVDGKKGLGLNEYLHIMGRKGGSSYDRVPAPVKVTVKDSGPLVATVVIESGAPGCSRLVRTLSIVDGSEQISCHNTMEKNKERKPESVFFAFPFNVAGGETRIDIPWGTLRPEKDQIKGANRNFFCVQRWADVSNEEYGITWIPIDAPLLQFDPIVFAPDPYDTYRYWREKCDPGQTLFSWVMNNHWETNYKADQEGTAVFRYILLPHVGRYDAVSAQQAGRAAHQPLVVLEADPAKAIPDPLFEVAGDGIVVTSIKPARSGRGFIIRLFNTSENTVAARIVASGRIPRAWLSNPAEDELSELSGSMKMVKHEIVTLKVLLLRLQDNVEVQ